MSTWIGDWQRGLISGRQNGLRVRARTQCKLGRHVILDTTPAHWVCDATVAPMGLSCLECLTRRQAELGRDLGLPVDRSESAKIPQQRAAAGSGGGRSRQKSPESIKHGAGYAYDRLKCRCDECRAFSAKRSADYRARRAAREAAAS